MRSVQLSFQTGTFTDTFILSLLLLCLKLAVVLPLTFYHSLCLSHAFSLSVSYRLSLSLSPALSLSCLFSLLHSPLSPHSSLLLSPLTPTTFPYIVTNLQDSYLSYKQILILDTETEWHSSECVQVRPKHYTNIIYSIIFM